MAKSRIIKEFVKGKIDLSCALRQLKVLLIDLGKDDLLAWVNNELQGYSSEQEIPSYRIQPGILKGNLICGNLKGENLPIALKANTPEDIKDICTNVRFTDSISAIEEFRKTNSGIISTPLPGEYLPIIQKYCNMSKVYIFSARIETGSSSIFNVYDVIQNKVLDILVLLEKEFGNLDELDLDLDEKTEESIEEVARSINYIIVDNSTTIGDGNEIKNSSILTNSELTK